MIRKSQNRGNWARGFPCDDDDDDDDDDDNENDDDGDDDENENDDEYDGDLHVSKTSVTTSAGVHTFKER